MRENASTLATKLKHLDNKITHIDIIYNKFNYDEFGMIVAALAHPNNRVERLNIHNSIIIADGIDILIDVLVQPHCRVTHLDLRGVYIGEKGLALLADALVHPHCKITYFNLHESYIGSRGANALANALMDPQCKISILDLGQYNKECIDIISGGLEKNINIQTFFPESPRTEAILARNKKIQEQIRNSVVTFLMIGKFRREEFSGNYYPAYSSNSIPYDVFRMIGKYLFSTRREWRVYLR